MALSLINGNNWRVCVALILGGSFWKSSDPWGTGHPGPCAGWLVIRCGGGGKTAQVSGRGKTWADAQVEACSLWRDWSERLSVGSIRPCLRLLGSWGEREIPGRHSSLQPPGKSRWLYFGAVWNRIIQSKYMWCGLNRTECSMMTWHNRMFQKYSKRGASYNLRSGSIPKKGLNPGKESLI